MTAPLSLTGYRLASFLATPLAGPILTMRLRRGKEDSRRGNERRGLSRAARPARLAAWRERRRSGRAAAVRRAHHAHGRDRARDHNDGDLGRDARAAPAGGRA